MILDFIAELIDNQNVSLNFATFKSVYEARMKFAGGKLLGEIINDFLRVLRLVNRQDGGGKTVVVR